MVDLSLMASAAISPVVLRRIKALCRSPNDMHILLPGHDNKQLPLKSNILKFDTPNFELPCKSISLLPELKQPGRQVLTNKEPVLIDVQDAHKDYMLSSFEKIEQFIDWKKTLKCLMFGSNDLEREGLNLSLLSNLMELHTVDLDIRWQQCVYMNNEFSPYESAKSTSCVFSERQLCFPPKPVLDNLGDLFRDTVITSPDGRLFFTDTRAEMDSNGLSTVSEFYFQKSSRNATKKAMVVPYFTRFKRRAEVSSPNMHTQIRASPSSPQGLTMKQQPKKQNRNAEKETYPNRKNYSIALETLMSFIFYRKGSKLEILLVKKSGWEISEILTQLSAGIAGIGLAMLLSVMYKMASGGLPLCSARLWNTGLGCLFLWIAVAVNDLRGTIVSIYRKSNKLKLKEEDVTLQVQQNVNQIFFRGATLFVAVLLRFV